MSIDLSSEEIQALEQVRMVLATQLQSKGPALQDSLRGIIVWELRRYGVPTDK